jgi:23S rRNA (cytosine1962-C5)-methyltransferase
LEAERVPLLRAVELLFQPKLLVERNDVLVRNLEKLPLSSQVLQGESSTLVLVTEGDLRFEVDLLEGQKTGAFLDQRDNRFQAAFFARAKKRILDAFSYQGWFACHMGKEAGSVMALEQSGPACRQIQRNCELNRIENISVTEANAFDFLKEADQRKERFNLINLDPPAFVKSRHQLSQALRGYKEINLRAMKLLEKDGILITSSCSHHLSEAEFLDVIRESALDAKRQVQILRVGQQASDHPILIGFPESRYLKCFFLRVL